MKFKVRLTHFVEMVVEGSSMEDVQEWLSNTTPNEAVKLATNSELVDESYDEDILFEVREDSIANFTIPSEEVIARYEYEHNDGDQCWSDYVTFIKRGSKYFRIEFEGYFNTETTETTDYETLVAEMAKARKSIEKERQWKIRGGYVILKDLI